MVILYVTVAPIGQAMSQAAKRRININKAHAHQRRSTTSSSNRVEILDRHINQFKILF